MHVEPDKLFGNLDELCAVGLYSTVNEPKSLEIFGFFLHFFFIFNQANYELCVNFAEMMEEAAREQEPQFVSLDRLVDLLHKVRLMEAFEIPTYQVPTIFWHNRCSGAVPHVSDRMKRSNLQKRDKHILFLGCGRKQTKNAKIRKGAFFREGCFDRKEYVSNTANKRCSRQVLQLRCSLWYSIKFYT